MLNLIDFPTPARLQAERESAIALPAQWKRCASCQRIPFDEKWLTQAQAAQSAEYVAKLLAAKAGDMQSAQSTAHWLRAVAHELDEFVLAEQVRKTRVAADAQQKALKMRRVRVIDEPEQTNSKPDSISLADAKAIFEAKIAELF